MPYCQMVKGKATAMITPTIRRNSQVEIGRIASARSRHLLRRITVPSFTTVMEPVAPASEALTVASALAGARMCRAGGASP
jgi:hypothetical protein